MWLYIRNHDCTNNGFLFVLTHSFWKNLHFTTPKLYRYSNFAMSYIIIDCCFFKYEAANLQKCFSQKCDFLTTLFFHINLLIFIFPYPMEGYY